MPENRADIDDGALGGPETEPQGLYIDIDQRGESAQQMERVGDGQHVKKGTARIAGNEDAGGIQLTPGQRLSPEKKEAERGSGGPPAVELRALARFQRAAGPIESHAR